MKRKICFLTDSVFSVGGIQRCVSVLANGLHDRNYEVHIICTDTRYRRDNRIYQLNPKIKVYIVHDGRLEKYLFGWTKWIRMQSKNNYVLRKNTQLLTFCFYTKNKVRNKKIIEYLNSNNIDIVIGAGGNQSILLGILKDRINAKVYGWQHSSCKSYFENPQGNYYGQRSLFEKYLTKLDQYIVLTKQDQEWISKHFHYTAHCIYNPKSFTSKSVTDLQHPWFISVGRYDKVKGYERLIDAFSLFAKKNNNWNLQIIGEGPLRDKLQEKINHLNLTNRIVLIPTPKGIESYYLNASIYLLSSYYEGLPMVLIESCECGLPIISFRLPCCIEQFSTCSLLIENDNIEQYAKAMEQLTTDKKLLNKLACNAKENSKKYEQNKILNEWEKILK